MKSVYTTFLLSVFLLMFISGAYAQTSLYGKVGIGKTEIKKFETTDANIGNTFLPNYNPYYEIGIIQKFKNKFSLKAGGGFSTYSCTVGLPDDYVPVSDDYFDKINTFYYLTLPIGVRYNAKWGLNLEAGFVNKIFLKHTYQELQFFYNIKKYSFVPYWGLSYTFFDRVELGFTDYIYLSHFAVHTDWYEQQNGIDPSIFFKYNILKIYVSYKIRLSKRDE